MGTNGNIIQAHKQDQHERVQSRARLGQQLCERRWGSCQAEMHRTKSDRCCFPEL